MVNDTPTELLDFVSQEQFRQLRDRPTGQIKTTSLLSYTSHGRLLILDRFQTVGDEQRALNLIKAFDESIKPTVLLAGIEASTGALAEPSLSTHHTTVVAAKLEGLSGYLGKFTAMVAVADKQLNLSEALQPKAPYFDLVLDLQTPPVLSQEKPPVGYFAPGDDTLQQKQALAGIAQMTGEFERPVFVEYNPAICAHTSSGINGCMRCLDSCQALAITSLKDKIAVNPYLCQGGGVCATVCPTGALRYVYPASEDLLARLRTQLAEYHAKTNTRPVLLVHDSESGAALLDHPSIQLDTNTLTVALEETASLGIEAWIALLAFGAARIDLLVLNDTPKGVINELKAQLRIANAILSGMGYPENLVRLINTLTSDERVEQCAPESVMPDTALARFAVFDNKRGTLRLACDHLYSHASQQPMQISLPDSAPFGRVLIDTHKCTLCMACVSVCPVRALNDGQDTPQLNLTESLCVQCDVCTRACPENALSLEARFVYDSIAARRPVVLNEEAPFCCIRCGVAFATRSMIERMGNKLAQHWMFQDGEALQRIQMCEDCRVKDIFLKNTKGIETHKEPNVD